MTYNQRTATNAYTLIETIMKGKRILIFLLEFQSRYKRAFISKQSKKSIAAKKGSRLHHARMMQSTTTLPTKARARVRTSPKKRRRKTHHPRARSWIILAVRLARLLYRRARDLSISQRASLCAPWLCMLEPWTAPRPCLTSCDALRSTSCGRWKVQTRRTPALRSTSAGR